MKIEPDIKAKITLTGRELVKSGYRPAHLIGDYYTTGLHQYIGTDTVNKGEIVEGYVTFLSPEHYPNTLKVGDVVDFYELSILWRNTMGLKDLFKKKEENTIVSEVERKSIFDTDYPMDKSNWKHVFSACLGQSVVTQDAMAELVVKDRNWFVDFSKGTLSFGEDAYPVQFIGSESSHSDTWMWGWNNINGFDESIIKLAHEVYDIGEEFNLEPLITKTFPLTDEIYGHTLAIVACGVSKGKYCYYRGPHDGGAIMMAVSGLPQEVFAPIDMQRFISTTMECIQQFELDHKIFVESLLMWNGTSYDCSGNTLVAHFAQDLMIGFEQVGDIVRITDIKTV